MAPALRILGIEPYFGGPHADFLDGLRTHSRHQWTLLTMPARNWKWRMRGGAMHLAREAATLLPREMKVGAEHPPYAARGTAGAERPPYAAKGTVAAKHPAYRGKAPYDLIFASNFLNVADFKALAPEPLARLPIVTYFHENQLSYPLEPGKRLDPQYGFANLVSALASTQVWFNSAFHRDAFQAAAKALLAKMPDFVPPDLGDSLSARSRVMPPGVNLKPFAEGRARPRGAPPLTILWNHRWEFDKNPEAFFEVLFFLAGEGIAFRLAVVGEAVRKWPPVFEKARRVLADRLVQFGYIREREAYERQVCQADLAVSTAFHEFFGLPIVEAIAAGCFPLMPARLSYPEIVPADLQATFFYRDERELRRKLVALLKGKGPWDRAARLAEHVQQYDWDHQIGRYDEALERAAKG
jgi:glycosyltransferase involved in cell wall biosynthesis